MAVGSPSLSEPSQARGEAGSSAEGAAAALASSTRDMLAWAELGRVHEGRMLEHLSCEFGQTMGSLLVLELHPHLTQPQPHQLLGFSLLCRNSPLQEIIREQERRPPLENMGQVRKRGKMSSHIDRTTFHLQLFQCAC